MSTLFALGDGTVRAHVLGSHDAAVATVADWIEAHAHTRYRIDGEVAVVDADGIITAAFRQHTSRAGDPQLHTHLVVANRVRSPDGRWLALDARTLKLDQRTLSAVYHATLRVELTRRLGVAWGPVVNGIADIAGVPDDVLVEFSSRTGDIAHRLDVKRERFVDTFGREPTPRERWRLEREAVLDSRPAKKAAVGDLRTEWVARVAGLGVDHRLMVDDAMLRTAPRPLGGRAVERAANDAIAALSERQSTWRPAELTREIAAALPTDAHLPADRMAAVLDWATRTSTERLCVDISRPVPDGAPLRRDGRPVTESAADRALTTRAILDQEARLIAWAERRRARTPAPSATAADWSPVPLTVPQAETAGAVAGHADLVMVVGPAGTGKTTALTPAVDQLRADGRTVFGVAPSAAAAEVLATETGIRADTLDKLLAEHRRNRPPELAYDLPAGATVIVDEAAMVPTDRLAALAELADERAWRVVLVGDPLQFSAVGRSGMFGLLTDTHGAIELDRIHRFAHPWERAASPRLRAGDPTVAEEYEAHGRLHGGTLTGVHRQAIEAWWAARQAGETVLLAAPTNDAVAHLNALAQLRRLDTGQLGRNGPHLTVGCQRLYLGDEIVTRRNHRVVRSDRGQMIRNRDRWTVAAIHPDASLTATRPSGTVRLPAHYVAEHVELGYATTSHATQGRTVDRAILVLDTPTDVRGLYVPLTRGRLSNDAYIATAGEETALDVFAEAITRSWIDHPAHVRRAELAAHDVTPGTLPPDELRRLLGEHARITDGLARLDADLEHLPRQLDQAGRRRQQLTDELAQLHERLRTATESLDRYDRPLRRRRHRGEIAAARHAIGHLPQEIANFEATLEQVAASVPALRRQLDEAQQLDRRRGDAETQLADVDARLADDRRLTASRQRAASERSEPIHATAPPPRRRSRSR